MPIATRIFIDEYMLGNHFDVLIDSLGNSVNNFQVLIYFNQRLAGYMHREECVQIVTKVD